jgi:hypothetical protein
MRYTVAEQQHPQAELTTHTTANYILLLPLHDASPSYWFGTSGTGMHSKLSYQNFASFCDDPSHHHEEILVRATTVHNATTADSNFFEAKTLRLIFILCDLINFSKPCPTSTINEHTATRAILAASFGPPTVFCSLQSNRMWVVSAGLSSAQSSRSTSFSQSERRIKILASQATSVSEMGLFIQSPLYLTSAHEHFPKRGCLGVKTSSRP